MGNGLVSDQSAKISKEWTFQKKVIFEKAVDASEAGIDYGKYTLVSDGSVLNIVNDTTGVVMGYFDSNGDLYMSGDVHTADGSQLVSNKAITEAEFRLASQEAKKRRGGSGFDDFGIISGTNINIGLKALNADFTIAESKVNINGHSIKIESQVISQASAPTDENARQDFVGLEVWEELVSAKDIVYPLGNVQNGLSTMNGIGTSVGTFTGYGTYSLFGNWQSSGDLVGKGLVWSTLTVDEKMTVLSDPENNIFLNEDGAYVQVRYRIRVIQGLTSSGAEWLEYIANNNFSISLNYGGGTDQRAKPKGSLTAITTDLAFFSSNESGFFLGSGRTPTFAPENQSIGSYRAINKTNSTYDTSIAYKGNCFMLPIAMVSRNRNQGGYHPVWNPMGTKTFTDGAWNVTALATSTAACLNAANLLTVSGYVSSGVSGRPDGLYYDEIAEGDVHDLRLPTNYNKNVDTELADTIKAERRGYEAEFSLNHFSDLVTSSTAFTQATIGVTTTSIQSLGGSALGEVLTLGSNTQILKDFVGFIEDSTGVYRECIWIRDDGVNSDIQLHPRYGDLTANFAAGTYRVVASVKTDRFQNNTQQRCEILGDPANYTFSSHVGVANLVDVNDGTSNLPDGAKTAFLMAGKVNTALTSVYKNGVLQVITTNYTFSSTTNEITFVVAPIATDVIEVFYNGYSSNFVPSVNEEVENLEGSESFETNFHPIASGSLLVNELLNKISTNSTAPNTRFVGFDTRFFFPSSSKYYTDANSLIKSLSLTTLTGVADAPNIKAYLYQTNKDGLLYNCLVFKEMKFDVDWGDDQKFDITDNIVTKTDDNGNVIIYGTVIDINPVGFAKD